ncbi:Nucleoside-diphosphate-sugar epimerase [Caballeronia sordidicola]|uniref:Nucleoside-diphosphate-sugar epimerase n=1 Tax=Caballeronia sordidicola TaxID=196367 RepID=A0A242MY89_CABSO|nr:Nucleoside-diphosphate-sugar epimerase [Caballeronia sordidicola]
MRGRGARR